MITFRKLYQSPKEGEIINAIVAYAKRPWVVEQCNHGDKGHEVYVEYKHKVHIDLWIVVIRLGWISKKPNRCKYKLTPPRKERTK